MSVLMLDALFPPSPPQLVADCRAVGAAGAFAYVSRPGGVGTWTPAHVAALRADGLDCIPIIVPPPSGADVGGLLAEAAAFGFSGGPIVLDLETPNLPPASWEAGFDFTAEAAGFSDLDYGRPADLGLYVPDAADWKAVWLRTGVLQPLPDLPAGWRAWQFVNDVEINGSQYDASVVDSTVLTGGDMTKQEWDAVCATVEGIHDLDEYLGALLGAARANFNTDNAVKAELDTIRAEIEAGGSVDSTTILTRIEAALQKA